MGNLRIHDDRITVQGRSEFAQGLFTQSVRSEQASTSINMLVYFPGECPEIAYSENLLSRLAAPERPMAESCSEESSITSMNPYAF